MLFEFVSRFTETDELSLEHDAEEKVLWNLCSVLETTLIEPLKKEYPEILEKARASIMS